MIKHDQRITETYFETRKIENTSINTLQKNNQQTEYIKAAQYKNNNQTLTRRNEIS